MSYHYNGGCPFEEEYDMDIKRGLSPQEYRSIGEQLSGLQPKELLDVLNGLRAGHDQVRQQEGDSGFLGPDRFLGIAMDRLAELVYRPNGRKPSVAGPEQQMA
jgi:hypothetical protein